MVDILHRIGFKDTTPEAVFAALTTPADLAAWWTRDTQGDGGPGGTLAFRFGEAGGFDMKVLDATPGERVLWEVVDGPEEWIGTQVRFDLRQVGDFTILLFAHEGWREPVEFMHHCSTRWALFLMSLKELVETGTGAPYPDLVDISDWT
jgi:uncharacterized protein YndB with AHSA1/START domain